jgi:4-amino-4-deoxy-L-arabinose transferase-like glycosyltransferase
LHLICRQKPFEFKILWGTAIGICFPFLVLIYYLFLDIPLISTLNAIVLCLVTVILLAAVLLRERQIGEKILISKANFSRSLLVLAIVFIVLLIIQVFLYTMLKVEYSDGIKHAASISVAFSGGWIWNTEVLEVLDYSAIIYSPGYAVFGIIGTSFSNSPIDGLKSLSFASWLILPVAFIPLANKISKRRLSLQEAVLISLILLSSPWIMIISSLNLQDGFLTLLGLLIISLTFYANKEWQFFTIGILLGISYLARGSQAILALFILLIILTSSQQGAISKKFRSIGYMILGGFITFLPWGIRMLVLFGNPFYSLQNESFWMSLINSLDLTSPFKETIIAGLGRYVSWLLIGYWSFFSLVFFAFFAILLYPKIKRKELDKTVDLRIVAWLFVIFAANIIFLSFYYSRQERYLTTILPLFLIIFYGVLHVQSKYRFYFFGIWTGWAIFHTLNQTKDYWYYVQGRSVQNLLDIFPDQPYRLPYENLIIGIDQVFYLAAFIFILIFALFVFFYSVEIRKISEHPRDLT